MQDFSELYLSNPRGCNLVLKGTTTTTTLQQFTNTPQCSFCEALQILLVVICGIGMLDKSH